MFGNVKEEEKGILPIVGSMHPLVRDLYKRFLIIGKDYPADGWKTMKLRIKEEFFKNRTVQNEEEMKRAVARGRYMTRELIGIIQLKKYRSMKSRYGESNN